MKFYIGVSSHDAKMMKSHHFPSYYLFSYYTDPTTYKWLKGKEAEVLVDSGAFSLQRKGCSSEQLNKYLSKYKQFISETTNNPQIKGYFEMDIDGHIGYDKVLEIRHSLEEISDKIIPVWHHTLGIKEFKRMVRYYPYVSISCVKDKDIPEKQIKYFVKYAHKHKTKIHGLGMTRKRVLTKVPFDSVDSTSWKEPIIWGRTNASLAYSNSPPKRLGRKMSYVKENRLKIIDAALLEAILKQKYYEKYWEGYSY